MFSFFFFFFLLLIETINLLFQVMSWIIIYKISGRLQKIKHSAQVFNSTKIEYKHFAYFQIHHWTIVFHMPSTAE